VFEVVLSLIVLIWATVPKVLPVSLTVIVLSFIAERAAFAASVARAVGLSLTVKVNNDLSVVMETNL
jgi:hypothetical protein